LFGAINNLIRACKSGNRTDFNASIAFLGNYVDKHFSDEEEIQKSQGFHGHSDHRVIHENYKAAVMKLAAKWLAAGPSEAVLKEVRTEVGSWLIDHIKGQDVRIGAFIRSKNN
jgi:hemerythrin